jgi:hypothetical protein
VVAGIGLGLVLGKVVLAGDKPQSVGNGLKRNVVNRGGSRAPVLNQQAPGPADVAAEAGVHVIYIDPHTLRPVHVNIPHVVADTMATPLPMFTYNVTASPDLGGGNFSGTILGRNPLNHGKTTTKIPTQLIPLVININDGITNITYDPMAPDPCVPGNLSVMDVVTGSPLFTNTPFTMNGVNVGTTQYIDAFQRAQFWSEVGGSGYHVVMNTSTLASQSLSFCANCPDGPGQNYDTHALFGACGFVGVVDVNDLNNAVVNLINGPLSGMINVGTFPIFVMKNIAMGAPGTNLFSNCCVLGFHNAFPVGTNTQIYSPFDLDTSGIFGPGYTSVMAHEIGEAYNDPLITNATPIWGNIGQTVGGCQGNLEVGDPLSPGFGTPTNPFIITGGNGLTYHLQELAFFSWFFGGPSTGTGGLFSNNGTFHGDHIPCPPGGTN